MDKTNGDAAALALGKALSGVIAEAIWPLEDKIEDLRTELKSDIRVLSGKTDQLAQRVDG